VDISRFPFRRSGHFAPLRPSAKAIRESAPASSVPCSRLVRPGRGAFLRLPGFHPPTPRAGTVGARFLRGIGIPNCGTGVDSNLRPAGFPSRWDRISSFLDTASFTRLQDESGRRLRGLRILRSETDQRRMVWMGNLLTRYNYSHVRVECEKTDASTRIRSWKADGTPSLDLSFDQEQTTPPCRQARLFPIGKLRAVLPGPCHLRSVRKLTAASR
jgi:hypothetical protein